MGKALVIVEGASAEKGLFGKLSESFGLGIEIFVYGTNIYDLYRIVKEDMDQHDGECLLNIRDILLDKLKTREDHAKTEADCVEIANERKLLNQEFAYTYLVYDCDIQHHERDEDPPIDELRDRNLPILEAMAEHFCDETDETVGKLYINYPMIESWRDADSCFDSAYAQAGVSLDEVKRYKEFTSRRKLAGRGLRHSREEFESIVRMMVYKSSLIADRGWRDCTYEEYQVNANAGHVLRQEADLMRNKRWISALNTSMFLCVDYKGRTLFDEVMAGGRNETVESNT